jgi:hypothetical protein
MKIEEIKQNICSGCDLKMLSTKEETESKLSTLCINGMLTLCFKKK